MGSCLGSTNGGRANTYGQTTAGLSRQHPKPIPGLEQAVDAFPAKTCQVLWGLATQKCSGRDLAGRAGDGRARSRYFGLFLFGFTGLISSAPRQLAARQ